MSEDKQTPKSNCDQWLLIATAPRNGTVFLGCTDKGVIQIIKFNKHLKIWVDVHGRESFREMTHWMPLPNPPDGGDK